MKVYAQVISGSVGLETSPSLMVFFDNARYLFNCGETTQRICFQSGAKLAKMDAVFLTKNEWISTGGLPGCILTASSGGKNQLSVVGPPNLTHSLVATRGFIGRPGLDLKLIETYNDQLVYKDEHLKVTAIPLLPTQTYDANYLEELNNKLTCSDIKIEEKKELCAQIFNSKEASRSSPLDRSETLKKLYDPSVDFSKRTKLSPIQSTLFHTNLPKVTPSNLVNCYLCEGKEVPGKFDLKAALALGLKPGKIFKELQAGNKVQNEKGEWILPEQCVESSRPGRQFLIVDCPSVNYLEALINDTTITKVASDVSMVFHMVADAVLEDQRYLDFVNKFNLNCQHIVSSKSTTPNMINFRRIAKLQAGMKLIRKDVFSSPQHSVVTDKALPKFNENVKCVVGLPDQTFSLEPKCKLEPLTDTTWLLPITDPKHPVNQFEAKLHDKLGRKLQMAIQKDTTSTPDYTNRTLVATLGTGSAVPSLTRNVSGNLIKLADGRFVLMDVGEGTLAQLHRLVGDAPYVHPKLGVDLHTLLDNLCLIYISHPHADHHLGLISVLQAIDRLPNRKKRPRYVVAPNLIFQFLDDYEGVEPTGIRNFERLSNFEVLDTEGSPVRKLKKQKMLTALSLNDLTTCKVNHCQQSFGVKLVQSNNHSIVYSGDCRPSPFLENLGKDCDLLLHEATMEDSMLEDAKAKKHSTITEALNVGYNMRAKNILLTHFSQRYVGLAGLDMLDQPHLAVGFDLAVYDVSEGTQDFQGFKDIITLADPIEQVLGFDEDGLLNT